MDDEYGFRRNAARCLGLYEIFNEADVQAKWHTATGYFSINPDAYNEPLVKEQYEKYPQLKVTVEQLQATKQSPATQGALISVFP